MEQDNVLIAPTKSGAGIKLLLTSLLGIAIFFIPFELAGRSTILVDHLAGLLMAQRPLALGLILLLIAYGAVTPLLDGRWRARPIDRLLSLFKLLGLGLALMYVAELGPAWLMTPDRLPFLFDKLAMSVGLIVPIGAMALTFLLGFGLL
ncbi:MAG: YjiH family protein, partial [Aeromonas sp.]